MNYRYFGKDNYGREFEGIGSSHQEILENNKKLLIIFNDDGNIQNEFRDVIFWDREVADEDPLPILFS